MSFSWVLGRFWYPPSVDPLPPPPEAIWQTVCDEMGFRFKSESIVYSASLALIAWFIFDDCDLLMRVSSLLTNA